MTPSATPFFQAIEAAAEMVPSPPPATMPSMSSRRAARSMAGTISFPEKTMASKSWPASRKMASAVFS
jgi:hypothetical protein